MKAKLGTEQLAEIKTWFGSINESIQSGALSRTQLTEDAGKVYDAFVKAGTKVAEDIRANPTVNQVLEAAGKSVDQLMKSMRSCPVGAKMPPVDGDG